MSALTLLAAIGASELTVRFGQVGRVQPTFIEADGPNAALGSLCRIEKAGGQTCAIAQVVSLSRDQVRLAVLTQTTPIQPGDLVIAETHDDEVGVGEPYAGRAIDGLGAPLDGGPAIRSTHRAPLNGPASDPFSRSSPKAPLETGIRAIDGVLPLAQGQRVGIFAAAGVGKTTLVTQLARQVQADRCVLCLVGERGREVEALWSGLPDAARARTTLVASTSDQNAALRLRASLYAIALAEHWREQGLSVLVILDSATRLAMAMREIGLAAGEPPTVRAYPPSVFSAVPKIVERFGALRSGGSTTAIMTVLCETDDADDPIAEMMKSLLDGHLLLSRQLAEQGHFPAIDITKSVSRLAPDLMAPDHQQAASRILAAASTYEEARTLVETGLYAAGSDAQIDQAIKLRPAIQSFLKQPTSDHAPRTTTIAELLRLAGRSAA